MEIWWQDEARIGQKNKRTRRWARKGTRPSAPQDQRTKSTYIFGAICPARGLVNRVMREVGPMSELAPAFPTAGGALAPLKAKAEYQSGLRLTH